MGKKVKTFKLKHNDPFVFEGDHGTYEIQPIEAFSYDSWIGVAEASTAGDTKAMLEAYKDFFLKVACPSLDAEQIGDNQWLQFGNAYFESMGE